MNLKVTLHKPALFNGVPVDHLVLREPEAIDNAEISLMAEGSADAHEILLLARLADVCPDELRRLHVRDFRRVQKAYGRFDIEVCKPEDFITEGVDGLVVRLNTPAIIEGVVTDRLTLREPLVKDLEDSGNASGNPDMREIALCSSLAGVSQKDFGRLTMRDLKRVRVAYDRFQDDASNADSYIVAAEASSGATLPLDADSHSGAASA